MKHGPPTLARLVAWSVLLLGLSVGCGSGCGDPNTNPPAREMPDADRSSVEVSKAQGVRANGKDAVDIKVTVRKDDGTPLSGRTVKVTVSGEGNSLTQPEGSTDDQGVATAKLTSTAAGTKTVTVSVEAEGGPVALSSRPTIEFVLLPASKLAFTSAPSSGTAGAALGVFEVAIQNADGETITSASNTVTVEIGSGPTAATLKGTASATAVNGVARFSELVIEKAAQGYTLRASAEGLTGATSASFDVAPGAATALALSAPVTPVTAGSAANVTISVRDAFGNDAAGYTGTVSFSSDDASATLPADYTFTSTDLGSHGFSLTLNKAGSRSVTVKDTTNAALSASAEIAVVPGAVAKLVFTQQPGNHRVRASFGAQVALADAFGNLVPAGAPAVTLSLNKGSLAGIATASPVDGVASFSGLSIAEEDSGYVLSAQATGVSAAPSEAFTITDDMAPALAVLTLESATATTATIGWTAVGDDLELGTASSYELRYSTSDIVSEATFALATPVTVGTPKPAGSAESAVIPGLVPGTAYYAALKVKDNQGNSSLSPSLHFSTPFASASKLAFTVQPNNGTAGAALAAIKVEIQDASGAVVGNATSVVTLTVQGATGTGTLSVAADKGVATFSDVRVEKAGTGYTLVASSGGLTSATSTAFDIAPAAAKSLELSGLAANVTAGAENTVHVTVRDAFDNVAVGYTGTVSFSSSDAAASKPADYTFTAADKGQHTFTKVILKTVGTQTLQVSASGLTSSTLTTEVAAPPPGKLVLTGLPAEVTAGAVVNVTVEALDGSNARDTGYTGTVRFTSSDAKAELPAQYTFTAADQGLKTFPVKLLTASAPSSTTSLTVQDTASPTFTATASTTVKWGPVASLVLAAPDTANAGNPLRVTVTALDAYGNTVKDYTGTVGFSADDASATLPADYTFTAGDEGSRQFDVTLKKAVTTKLTVTDAARSLSAFDTVSVSHASASELVLVVPSVPVTAGTAVTFDVTLKDAFGNVATGYTGTVGFTSSDAQAALPANYTFAAGDAGHKAFSVTLKTAASSQSVSVKDLVSTFLTGTASLQVDASTPAKLAFRAQPSNGTVRTTLPAVTVAVTDAYGNTLNVGTPEITVALAGGNASAVLGGTVKAMPVAGVATFSTLTVDQQGSGFRLDAMGGTLDGASSTAFSIVDNIAPGVVTLSVAHKTSVQVALNWTAVGDDDLLGTASSYDLRYSTSPITDTNFGSATSVSVGSPQAPGTLESAIVISLNPDTLYYFGLKVTDDANNSRLATVSTKTNVNPCAGYTCTPPSPTCAADGVSRTTYTSTCVDVDNTATCQESQTTTACTGTNAVCFKGLCDTAAKPAANQLSITEAMHSPSAGTTEYFEVLNNTGNLLNLNGLLVTYKNGSGTTNTFTVGSGSAPVVIDRKGTFVLAQNKDLATNGGVSANYQYGSAITLDGSGQFMLSNGAVSVEDFSYTAAFPQTSGKAMSLSSVVVGTKANANPWYWCDADVLLAGGDYGTPNAANSTCGVAAAPPVDWCIIQSPKTLPSTVAGTSTAIYSQFYEPSVTDRNKAGNDGYPYVFAELGYGPTTGSAAAWTWSPISFNGGYSTSGDNDEMVGMLNIATAGSYRYGFRYYFKDPVTGTASPYVYCDQNGVADPVSGVFGTVTITAAPPTGANHVVISEFSGGLTGAATNEFIELYNPTDTAVDISNWVVQYRSATGSTYTQSSTLPAGSVIQPKKYFLIGGAGYSGGPAKDASYTFDSSASTTGGGHVRIGKPGLTASPTDALAVDTLGYGTATQPEGTAAPSHPASGGSLERKAVSTSTSASMGVGGADAARGNGYDSDNNSQDFVTRATRDPQNSASAAESP
ncbi:lamin tail domain-containing protein [Vitiosangium sp. GDMCC 1.1324]|uniref:lamin tail domain-containing protein n=1 Tax=Vitiosangium sp. (strain GDMCC 1.1324) TaxID=2138576 RepID=UPI000D3C16BC|nr:lamin tail domain-containing protein [Vitiosangium sp. GDMCC 1.1324]PTL78609.1 hypothetical protein DAT35_39510 [Vitiosangium sp. GDMCC 1.1324]